MKRSSFLRVGAERSYRSALMVGAAVVCGVPALGSSLALAAQAQPGSTITIGGPRPAAQAPRLNPTGRTINVTVPFKDGNFYVGDVIVSITPQDEILFSGPRVLDLLRQVVDPRYLDEVSRSLENKTVVTPADFAGSGITIAYDPRTLELRADIPPGYKASRALSVADLDQDSVGRYYRPAGFSAYLNTRAAIDYVHKGGDQGWDDPNFFLDGAARFGKVAFETEALFTPNQADEFQRLGSRFVYDSLGTVTRWTLGDLEPTARGFQATPDVAGLSVARSYGVLQPQRNVRPRGDQSFTLNRPSNVEIYVNGQIVRRVRLNPGNYNLRDFPFTQGANDIRVVIEDETGARESLRFNVFFDRTQLDKGLSEFGMYAGLRAPLAGDGPDYSDDFTMTGFYRRGITDRLTLGGNVQFDDESFMAGVEGVWGSPIGTVTFDVARSRLKGLGQGTGVTLTLQQLIRRPNGRADSLNVFVEHRTKNFGPIGVGAPDNRFEYEVGAAYSRAFSDRIYAALDTRYSKGRGAQVDIGTYRGSLGFRINDRMALTVDAVYEDAPNRRDWQGLISLTTRLNPWSTLRADYDRRDDRARVSYQALRGSGVGSYAVAADLERTSNSSAFNANASYFANRAELGAAHFTGFDGSGFGDVSDQRTSLRVASSIAVADGAWSVGRPVYNSFAVVKRHESLRGADVYVNPSEFGYTANTGRLGTALETNLSSYSERTITVEAVGAPAGYDIGAGSFRVLPPHRGGYLLEVGSDYSVTALGRLIGADGQPISLIAGRAIQVNGPADREPVVLFTNRVGRFGASGLAPGVWRIEMNDPNKSVFVVTVPENTEGVFDAGELRPSEGN